ncbi:hypothetical protein ACFLU6_12645, partial [Acidobacteriota bacterium]
DVLRDISQAGRKEFGISGSVQHGASTLPDGAFNRFPEHETAEVHLSNRLVKPFSALLCLFRLALNEGLMVP